MAEHVVKSLYPCLKAVLYPLNQKTIATEAQAVESGCGFHPHLILAHVSLSRTVTLWITSLYFSMSVICVGTESLGRMGYQLSPVEKRSEGSTLVNCCQLACVDEISQSKQPYLAESNLTLVLGEAAHLLHIELSVCTGSTSHRHTHSARSPATSASHTIIRSCTINQILTPPPPCYTPPRCIVTLSCCTGAECAAFPDKDTEW